MLRPIVFFDQSDAQNIDRDHEFLCGDHILVCPVIKEEKHQKNMYLPKGQWFDFWTGTLHAGETEHTADAPIDRIPIYVKQGAVIPKYPIQQYVGEKEITEVTLSIYHSDEKVVSEFYEDGGDGYEYESGGYRMAKFAVEGNKKELRITQNIEGDYTATFGTYVLELVGLPFYASNIVVDGKSIERTSTGVISVDAGFGEIVIS